MAGGRHRDSGRSALSTRARRGFSCAGRASIAWRLAERSNGCPVRTRAWGVDPPQRCSMTSHARGVFVCLLIAGCGQGSGPQSASSGPATASAASVADESCLGFTLIGLKNSPGGSTLPHTCKPFDAVTNNPYAIRCVDAMPDYKTPWASDEFCILPPPPDKGLQLGVHPQGDSYWDKMYAGNYSDYSNKTLTEPFVVQPGTEVVQNYDVTVPNPEAQSYFRVDSRMRD